jgi:hypothetical protein
MTNDRYLNGKKVSAVWYYDYYTEPKIRGMLAGQIEGELVVGENGLPIPYKKIGELEGEKHAPEHRKVRRK